VDKHSEIAAVPEERLAVERDVLAPLPSLRPEIGAASVRRKVDRLSCIRYGSARYSVPTRLIGATVNIVIDHGALLMIEPATGEIVAEHELVAPGETSILDKHYDEPGPRPVAHRGRKPQWPHHGTVCWTVPHQTGFCPIMAIKEVVNGPDRRSAVWSRRMMRRRLSARNDQETR
jgi:hypothetical protein